MGFFKKKTPPLPDDPMRLLQMAQAEKDAAKNRAVRIITASALSEKKLAQRLREKGTSQQDAEETVRWLHELHLTDDARTAEMLVDSAVRKGYGRRRIESILFEKGIPEEIRDQALARIPVQDDAIDRYLHQKLDGKPLDEKLIKKTLDALVRRGHDWESIKSALSRYREQCDFPDPEDLE